MSVRVQSWDRNHTLNHILPFLVLWSRGLTPRKPHSSPRLPGPPASDWVLTIGGRRCGQETQGREERSICESFLLPPRFSALSLAEAVSPTSALAWTYSPRLQLSLGCSHAGSSSILAALEMVLAPGYCWSLGALPSLVCSLHLIHTSISSPFIH